MSMSFRYQHQPQEIQDDKHHCKYKRLLNAYCLSSYHHQTMIKNTADAATFYRSDKKSA